MLLRRDPAVERRKRPVSAGRGSGDSTGQSGSPGGATVGGRTSVADGLCCRVSGLSRQAYLSTCSLYAEPRRLGAHSTEVQA